MARPLGIRFKVTIGVCAALLAGGGVLAAVRTMSGPDYVTNRTANSAASAVSLDLQPKLESAANFVGLRIIPSGVEVVLSSAPTAAQTSAIAAERANQRGTTVPVSVRTVPNSLASLNALTDRLDADAPAWERKGITLSSWGPDIGSDTVVVHLKSYSASAAQQLQNTYGPALKVARGNQSASG